MSTHFARGRTMRLKVWGSNACFTRPEMKVERVSYDVMTPSAARGILEAILWKPAITWRVERIDVIKPIKWESVRRNEVGSTMSERTSGLFVEDNRQQRAGLLLRDVEYVIHAHFQMTPRAGADDNAVKFEEMFMRRAQKGQCFHRPYLGCREFAAHFELVDEKATPPKPFDYSTDLGFMLYDLEHDENASKDGNHFCTDKCVPLFFRAKLDSGKLVVPAPDSLEVRR